MSSQATTYVKFITNSPEEQFFKCFEHAISGAKIATRLNEIAITQARILGKIFGTKLRNLVKVDRKRKV